MGTTKNMDVSVIIVNYNTRKLTGDCIASVIEKTHGVNYEIIMVDNASSDNSVEYIANKFPQVKIISNKKNTGFGSANNAGAAIACGKYLFLLNSDTVLLNNAIGILNAFMQQDTKMQTAACCANLYTADEQPNFSYLQYNPSLFRLLLYKSHFWIFSKSDSFNDTGKEKDVEMIIGAHLFIRKALFDSVGGFDPHFFMYLEDTDLCLRLNKAGYKLTSVPEAKIIHYQGKSSLIGSKLIMESKSFIYYFKKHGTPVTVALYKFVEFSFAFIKMLAFTFNPQRRKAYYELMKFLIT